MILGKRGEKASRENVAADSSRRGKVAAKQIFA